MSRLEVGAAEAHNRRGDAAGPITPGGAEIGTADRPPEKSEKLPSKIKMGTGRQSFRSCSAMRLIVAAMYPAPNPLSILTTATPAAHAFSIANNGASPLKLAP